jgi:hypothetical protein
MILGRFNCLRVGTVSCLGRYHHLLQNLAIEIWQTPETPNWPLTKYFIFYGPSLREGSPLKRYYRAHLYDITDLHTKHILFLLGSLINKHTNFS